MLYLQKFSDFCILICNHDQPVNDNQKLVKLVHSTCHLNMFKAVFYDFWPNGIVFVQFWSLFNHLVLPISIQYTQRCWENGFSFSKNY